MKTVNILSAAALTLLVATGTHAEQYDGVHTSVSSKMPEDVNAEAVRTASAPDQNVASGSRVNSKVISTMPHPADARAQAK